jgi:Ca2+-binding EF-hand superfamily protein
VTWTHHSLQRRAENRLDSSFNYAKYLGLCLEKTLEEIVIIYEPTWAIFAVFAVIFFVYSSLLNQDLLILAWIWIGICYLINLLNCLFRGHLVMVVEALGSKAVDSEMAGEHHQQGDYILLTDERIPKWCEIELDQASTQALGNRQQMLFLFREHAPKTYLVLLQSNLVFSSIYWALSFVTYFPFMYEEQSFVYFVLYVILAFIPSALSMQQWISIAACLTQVTSIGYLRRPALVARVTREHKAEAMIRAFLLVQRVRKFVNRSDNFKMKKTTGRRKTLSSCHQRQVELAFKAIDENDDGYLDESEFESLMQRLGLPVTIAMGSKIVGILDMDGDGVVDLNEFSCFYEEFIVERGCVDPTPRQMARELFSIFDIDGSGDVTLNEFVKTLEAFNLGFTIEDIGEILH